MDRKWMLSATLAGICCALRSITATAMTTKSKSDRLMFLVKFIVAIKGLKRLKLLEKQGSTKVLW
ncbi:MAG: hypothetical protein Roseis2KO_41010 [Roseivirga sp.]